MLFRSREESAPSGARYGWGWLIAIFLASLTFIIGRALPYFDKHIEGLVLEAIGVVLVVALLLAWVQTRRRALARSAFPQVTPGTPYRMASAKISPDFVTELANLETHLQRSAVEEGWSIEWTEHNQVFQSAKTALAERRYSESLRDFAKAIHVLMGGIHLLRKQRDQILRWGARVPTNRDEEPEGK